MKKLTTIIIALILPYSLLWANERQAELARVLAETCPDYQWSWGNGKYKKNPCTLDPKLVNSNPGKITDLYAAVSMVAIDPQKKDGMLAVKVLVARGANINHITAGGFTPLDKACAHQNQELIDFLKSHGARNNSIICQ